KSEDGQEIKLEVLGIQGLTVINCGRENRPGTSQTVTFELAPHNNRQRTIVFTINKYPGLMLHHKYAIDTINSDVTVRKACIDQIATTSFEFPFLLQLDRALQKEPCYFFEYVREKIIARLLNHDHHIHAGGFHFNSMKDQHKDERQKNGLY